MIVFTIYQKFTDRRKLFKSSQIYRKDVDYSENYFLVPEFFCATFSFWDTVNFDVCDMLYVKDLRDFCEPDSDINQWS